MNSLPPPLACSFCALAGSPAAAGRHWLPTWGEPGSPRSTRTRLTDGRRVEVLLV